MSWRHSCLMTWPDFWQKQKSPRIVIYRIHHPFRILFHKRLCLKYLRFMIGNCLYRYSNQQLWWLWKWVVLLEFRKRWREEVRKVTRSKKPFNNLTVFSRRTGGILSYLITLAWSNSNNSFLCLHKCYSRQPILLVATRLPTISRTDTSSLNHSYT